MFRTCAQCVEQRECEFKTLPHERSDSKRYWLCRECSVPGIRGEDRHTLVSLATQRPPRGPITVEEAIANPPVSGISVMKQQRTPGIRMGSVLDRYVRGRL